MTAHPAIWIGFGVFVLAMLALDLGVFHRKSHVVGFKEALGWTGAWVALALLFNLGLWAYAGREKALEFAILASILSARIRAITAPPPGLVRAAQRSIAANQNQA